MPPIPFEYPLANPLRPRSHSCYHHRDVDEPAPPLLNGSSFADNLETRMKIQELNQMMSGSVCSPPSRSPVHSRLLVIYTGGTIGMCEERKGMGLSPKPNFLGKILQELPLIHDKEYAAIRSLVSPPILPQKLNTPNTLFVMPELQQGTRVEFEILEYSPLLDSSNMTHENWTLMARDIKKYYDKFDGFVVLHGTDTMAYTASALSMMCSHLGKPIVLTGSQVPIFEHRSDARENLMGALFCAGHYSIPEVTVFFKNKLYRGNRVSKVDSSSYDAFHSPNMQPLADIDMHVNIRWDIIYRDPELKEFEIQERMEPNVTILRFYPGLTAELVENFLRPPVRGVVLQTFGSGNGPDSRPEILRAFKKASEDGVLIINCTQCYKGGVSPSYASGVALKDSGVIFGGDMTPEAALTKLSYVLAKDDLTLDERREMMKQNIRGELSVENVAHGEISLRHSGFLSKLASALQMSTTPEVVELNNALMPSLLCVAAANPDNAETLRTLLNSKEGTSSISCGDYDRRTPLHVAASAGIEANAKLLVENGANVHSKDVNGDTPLICAVRSRQVEIVRVLVQAGAHFPYSDGSRVASEVCLAAYNDDSQMLQAFAEAGVDFSVPDIHGNYALHVACAQKNHKCITMLLTHGANPSSRNTVNKESALDVSRRIQDTLGEKLLETFLNPSDVEDEISEDENENIDSCFVAQSKNTNSCNRGKEAPRESQNNPTNDLTGQSSNSRSNLNND